MYDNVIHATRAGLPSRASRRAQRGEVGCSPGRVRGDWWLHPAVTRVKAVAMADGHDDERRVPVEQALYGLTVHPLPKGWTPLSAIVLVKCLDEDGEPTWAFRTTEGLNDEELLGTLTVRTELLRRELVDSYYDGDD